MECNVIFNGDDLGADYVGKCFDETVVEICKFYECLDDSNAYRGLLSLYGFNFLGGHVNVFGKNDQS